MIEQLQTEILKSAQLKITRIRLSLLTILMDSMAPLTCDEIFSKLGLNCDRVTVYRNLAIFLEMGLISRDLLGTAVHYYELKAIHRFQNSEGTKLTSARIKSGIHQAAVRAGIRLKNKNQSRRPELTRRTQYDNTSNHHHHLICTDCRKVTCIDVCGVERNRPNIEAFGYKNVYHKLEFYGTCRDCQNE